MFNFAAQSVASQDSQAPSREPAHHVSKNRSSLKLVLGSAALFATALPCISSAQELATQAATPQTASADPLADLQSNAVQANASDLLYWGLDPAKYSTWKTHSNRLVPIYTFGGKLDAVVSENSVYRDEAKLNALYGYTPDNTLNPAAEYCDQTDIYKLQQQAISDGKKRVILFVFDGMDWQTTQAASIYKHGRVLYSEGRGKGLAFQDYRGTATDFGAFVSSPHNDGTNVDVNAQRVTNPNGRSRGGYVAASAGESPWSVPAEPAYLIGKGETRQPYTDSAASATSMTCGVKTYNGAINVDFAGREILPIARELQGEGFAVGAVSSVPISHATPACAYANNVVRNDYQDITRDLLGIPSVFHPGGIPGLDVLIGCGVGETRDTDGGQGKNFVPGNRYLSNKDLDAINVTNGGKYIVAVREPGRDGTTALQTAAKTAAGQQQRLFGFYGVAGGHLPYQTADGKYDPVQSFGGQAEAYTEADVEENPNLAEMSIAAAEVLQAKSDKWWLMIEAGDVDWANHANNIDDSVGALLSGEQAFAEMASWIEANGGWDDTFVIVTADHGHMLVLEDPAGLAAAVAK